MTTRPLRNSLFVESLIPIPAPFGNGKSPRVRVLDAIARGSQTVLDFDTQHRNKHLCKFCRRLTFANLKRGLYHRKNLEDLRESSNSCNLCALFLAAFEKVSYPEGSEWPNRLWIKASGEVLDRISLVLSEKSSTIRLFCNEGDGLAAAIRGRPIRPHANCEENFNLANTWLADCQLNHPECFSFRTNNGEDPALPTRVIDVGLNSGSVSARLLVTNGQRGKWVALSHCWGKLDIIRLTDNNQEALQEQIPDHCLPQTFRDAILITRKLNIRYLWIDSLCIFQDSRIDWQAESMQMPMVYAEAQIVLAANAAPTSHGGILTARSRQSCSFDTGHLGQVHFGLEPKVQEPDYLGERAWCFQEEHLGRRRLSYYSEYMEFSCSRHSRTELDRFEPSKPFPKEKASNSLPRFRTLAAALTYINQTHLKRDVLQSHRSIFHGSWIENISEYSRRKLTVSDDKLVAISGMTRQMGPVLDDEYLAGLWLQQLPSGLLWQRLDSCIPLTRPTEYRAPSWSWAAVDGEIVWQRYLSDAQRSYQCEVLEAKVVAREHDVYGQVVDGLVRLRARIKPALVGLTVISKPFGEMNKASELVLLSDPSGDEAIGHLPSCLFDTAVPAMNTEVLCMEICSGYVFDMSHSDGLIIEPLVSQPGVYRRSGIFRLSESRWEFEHGSLWFEGCEEQVVTII